ncbi:hypothetical protein BAOM_3564 [Peribacillus asahii]|uniref:Helicase Helix-turn-helix domain-containing protein n=1 Tax=Peribacillus asahii TaxID=228899 RepID=A0A3T0KVA1_9BACI|nr:hypothetical protein BAOM_3564 [Peribacillus asahii]
MKASLGKTKGVSVHLANYLQVIILHTIKKFQGERSIYAIYHMLQGKKSSQTIQDAHLFRLTNVFGTIPHFTRKQLVDTIQNLVEHGWITAKEKSDVFIITQSGEEELAQCEPIPTRLNGWKYQNVAPVFWGRLNLLIQTLSHIVHNETKFYPIQRHTKIQQSVKQFLQKNRQNRELMAQHLYEELTDLLERQSDRHQTIFVRKLTGINRVGQTFDQISKTMQLDEWYVRYVFLESLHWMFYEIEKTFTQYRLLSSLIGDLQQSRLTQSTQTTLQFIQAGRTLTEIANIRRLKVNTIEDHLVEIVLVDKQFPIHEYVTSAVEEKILQVMKKLQTKQLKAIRQSLADEAISFFQIRLVLAKAGDEL